MPKGRKVLFTPNLPKEREYARSKVILSCRNVVDFREGSLQLESASMLHFFPRDLNTIRQFVEVPKPCSYLGSNHDKNSVEPAKIIDLLKPECHLVIVFNEEDRFSLWPVVETEKDIFHWKAFNGERFIFGIFLVPKNSGFIKSV